jgi:hypothetical protein
MTTPSDEPQFDSVEPWTEDEVNTFNPWDTFEDAGVATEPQSISNANPCRFKSVTIVVARRSVAVLPVHDDYAWDAAPGWSEWRMTDVR